MHFASYDYTFKGTKFLLYVVNGNAGPYSTVTYNYILTDISKATSEVLAQGLADELIKAATSWGLELHNEVLIFDQGFWQPNKELWQNIQKSNWEDVILDQEKKDTIIDDVTGFFDAEDRYAEFNVPWKRGVIFYGPPGVSFAIKSPPDSMKHDRRHNRLSSLTNLDCLCALTYQNGKTISTKALMNDVSKRTSPTIESLYVKTFQSYAGPEYGIRQIFSKARQMAPCLLIFEDIDSLVNVSVRSYFLNEVDGLESNHGILMIGSTNHLEQLDPGIAKRPSRFDRKYFFDDPNKEERIQYADYWRNKLKDNKKIDFPEEMSPAVADITDGFSFAYMKEAFVAALLVIVAKKEKKYARAIGGDPLSDNLLWNEIRRQVDNLRKEMDGDHDTYMAKSIHPVATGSSSLKPRMASRPRPPMPQSWNSSPMDFERPQLSGDYPCSREGPDAGQHAQYNTLPPPPPPPPSEIYGGVSYRSLSGERKWSYNQRQTVNRWENEYPPTVWDINED